MNREIWLIRHGESTTNIGAATRDAATIPLTELGWQQAHATAAKFSHAPQLIVVSSYLRAQQTAAPTIERFPDAPVETWPVQEFTYLSPVYLANTTAAQRRPLVDAYWRDCDPASVDGPGAESFAQMLGRVRDTARRIQATPARSIAIFTHGQIMQAWRVLADNPAATDKHDMERFLTAFHARPFENCEWLSGAAYRRVARS